MTALQFSMLYSVGSIVLGIGAWGFACLAIASKKRNMAHCSSVASFTLCAISLVLQLFEISNRVNIGDFSAIIDTIRAVILAAMVLVVVTITLNVVAFIKVKDKQ